jgi:tetratricopeptide (TPR) repeat protein
VRSRDARRILPGVQVPAHIQSRFRAAVALESAGRTAEAIAAYEEVTREAPALADAWYNLGRLRRRARDAAGALAAYATALERGVSQPEEVHLNRAVVYADDLHDATAAARELDAALALHPRYVPALLNYANLHEDLGARERAAARYREALAIDGACFHALARLAALDGSADPSNPMIARLAVALDDPRATAADRADLAFALAAMLDRCGLHDLAFETGARANRESRSSAPGGPVVYDRAAHERHVDALIEAFAAGIEAATADGVGAASADRVAPRGSPCTAAAPRLVFVCGMYRSGSTLAERVLAAHPRVGAGGELPYLDQYVAGPLAPFPDSLRDASTAARLDALASDYRDRVAALFPGAAVVTDKRPDNFLLIGLIKTLFPDAKIVHTVRNPLDTCLSIYFLHLDHSMPYALDLLDTGHYFREYRRLMQHWHSRYPGDILDFDYDAFVRAPREGVAALLEFCGLDWDEHCLAPERAAGAVRTASVWQVREPVYVRSSGRWRNYRAHLAPLAALLGESLEPHLDDSTRPERP